MNNATNIIPASKASKLETVTYVTKIGGIGLGKLTGTSVAVIVNNGGNGYYYPVAEVAAYFRDNGKGYMDAAHGIHLPPAYTA